MSILIGLWARRRRFRRESSFRALTGGCVDTVENGGRHCYENVLARSGKNRGFCRVAKIPPKQPLHQEDLVSIIEHLNAVVAEMETLEATKRIELKRVYFERTQWYKNRLKELYEGCQKIEAFIKDLNPAKIEEVQLTLSRSEEIAKFFALKFTQQPRLRMDDLDQNVFFGSGVYAIYYIGRDIRAYAGLSHTESPIYIGKADPESPFADTTVKQGGKLWTRLREHAKTIRSAATTLKIEDFEYRYGTIQSGMQSAVEEFLIRFFGPIWNEQIDICFGIGKHGDAAETRKNGRSPWDTMHPGRSWADDAPKDQVPKAEIEARIGRHLAEKPPHQNLDSLIAELIRS